MQSGVQRIGSLPPDETEDAYGGRLRAELRALWTNVIARRAPGILPLLSGESAELPQDGDVTVCLQALNIWF